ncbi:MAG: ATP-dependent Clp protease adaptor ClpS [Kofleriaceae bacterium]
MDAGAAMMLASLAAALTGLWMGRRAPPPPDRLPLAADAEVALHVAMHDARSRSQELSTLHLLYGLIQDDAIAAAIRSTGGDVDALEDQILGALDQRRETTPDELDELQQALGIAVQIAREQDRPITCVDLWSRLTGGEPAALLDATGISRGAVLFELVHGSEPELAAMLGTADAHAVLRNDDYTPQEFVCHVLREVFGLPDAAATGVMMATHTQGRAVIGRFTAPEARARIAEARTRARAAGFPLWIGIEPV